MRIVPQSRAKAQIGESFGKATLIGAAFYCRINGETRQYAVFVCECGNHFASRLPEIIKGDTEGCRACMNRTHGQTGSLLYKVWVGIKHRCQNPKSTSFKDYGGRGISVCESWQEFMPFQQWAISNGYREGLEIDRINNDGNYEPGNCHWTTTKVNCNNRRSTRHITAFGETKTLNEWSEDEKCLVSRGILGMRIRNGWPAEQAICTPRQKPGPKPQ